MKQGDRTRVNTLTFQERGISPKIQVETKEGKPKLLFTFEPKNCQLEAEGSAFVEIKSGQNSGIESKVPK